MLKKIVPYSIRLRYRLLKRWLNDVRTGAIFCFAKAKKTDFYIENNFKISVEQPILYTPQSAAKTTNISIAAAKINEIVIQPNEIFSFWQIVEQATAARGYQKGRNLIDGKLVEDTGGGLCQLASILYHTALLAGLEIVERYPHSIDIYKNDSERFTPLGADATVVFGFKDLRLKNIYNYNLYFDIIIKNNVLICTLYSKQNIISKNILFKKYNVVNNYIKVETLVTGISVATSEYLVLSE